MGGAWRKGRRAAPCTDALPGTGVSTARARPARRAESRQGGRLDTGDHIVHHVKAAEVMGAPHSEGHSARGWRQSPPRRPGVCHPNRTGGRRRLARLRCAKTQRTRGSLRPAGVSGRSAAPAGRGLAPPPGLARPPARAHPCQRRGAAQQHGAGPPPTKINQPEPTDIAAAPEPALRSATTSPPLAPGGR